MGQLKMRLTHAWPSRASEPDTYTPRCNFYRYFFLFILGNFTSFKFNRTGLSLGITSPEPIASHAIETAQTC